MKTIKESAEAYLDSVKLSRSINTALTYRHAINFYIRVLEVHNIDIQVTLVTQLNEDTLIWFANDLKVFSTESPPTRAASSAIPRAIHRYHY